MHLSLLLICSISMLFMISIYWSIYSFFFLSKYGLPKIWITKSWSNSKSKKEHEHIRSKRKCSWLDPTYSWNTQLAHTPFPKEINTPSTTLRFIGFVAKISVFNPKLLANDQFPKKTKESFTFVMCSLHYRFL